MQRRRTGGARGMEDNPRIRKSLLPAFGIWKMRNIIAEQPVLLVGNFQGRDFRILADERLDELL